MRYSYHFMAAGSLVFGTMLLLACSGVESSVHESSLDAPEQVGVAEEDVVAAPCAANQVSPTCKPASCGIKRCGGFLWANNVIPYQISSSLLTGGAGDPDIAMIDSAAAAWTSATGNVVSWQKCAGNNCSGKPRFVTVQLCVNSDGTPCGTNFTANDNININNNIDFTTVAHEMGHVLGQPHAFWRNDRDRYITMSSSLCGANAIWTCALGDNTDVANPPVATGLFGVYESTSLMNYTGRTDICENDGQEPGGAAVITNRDGASVQELYLTTSGWAPFQNLGKDIGATQPLSHNLVSSGPTVTLVGAPATSSWGPPLLDIFVLGSDNHIHYKWKNVSAGVFQSWANWFDLGGDFNSEPAAVSWGSGRTDLVARKTDGDIYIKTYSGGAWSGWSWLDSPPGGAASAPAITSWGPGRLDVFVRGTDDSLWQRTFQNSWEPTWIKRGGGTFRGKPAVTSWGVNRIDVAVHGMDDALWTTWFDGTWHGYATRGGELYHSGTTYGAPTIASRGINTLDIFFRGMDSRLWQKNWNGSAWSNYIQLGGVITGDPGAIGKSGASSRLDIVAPNTDHGNPGVWWKYWPFDAGCVVEGSCGSCGCDDDPNTALPACIR